MGRGAPLRITANGGGRTAASFPPRTTIAKRNQGHVRHLNVPAVLRRSQGGELSAPAAVTGEPRFGAKSRQEPRTSYLSSGGTMTSVAESYRIGFGTTIRLTVPEACRTIWEELGPQLMELPSAEQWRQHVIDLATEWQFPSCDGALDGKHIMIEKPANSGSMNFNNKGYCSVVMMAKVDAKYRFRYVSAGSNGQESDGGVWAASDSGQLLEAQEQDGRPVLPGPASLPNSPDVSLPHVFVGDEAFPLRPHLMRPFPGSRLTSDERRVFNYRLSRARRTSENESGILAQRWRVFRGPMRCCAETVKLIALAACVLHNFLREKDVESQRQGAAAYGHLAVEEPGEVGGLRDLRGAGASHNHTRQAAQIRDEYVTYFSGAGSVAWQLDAIHR